MTNKKVETTFRVALYCRVSKSTQMNENQKLRLVQYAEENKLDYDLFEEVESSRKSRPVKQEVLNKLRNGEYSAILVYKLDRYARSSRELILEIQELLDKGIGFISISDNLDFRSSMGRLHFQILAAFAEFERSLISERTKEGINRARMQGANLGRPKGKKDSNPRRKSGYIMREANKRKMMDEQKGNFQSIDKYIK